MADNGRDIVDVSVVYQVKWSRDVQRNPSQWLTSIINDERANIKALVRERKITRYVLMTSVAATTVEEDKLQDKLKEYSAEFGIPVMCWWQADIDADLDSAPDSLKWAYPEMLAGFDAIRALMYQTQRGERGERMAEVVRAVMSTQWDEDTNVKFTQIDMKTDVLTLFVDPQVSFKQSGRFSALRSDSGPFGGVEYLLDPKSPPFTYLLGVPGQGKSTLGQYLCQLHRATILVNISSEDVATPKAMVEPRMVFRVDLRDYAAWLSGFDPYLVISEQKPTRRQKSERSLESFLAHFCRVKSGGMKVSVDDIHDFLERYPTLAILDGLDEIADRETRFQAVDEINRAAARWRAPHLLQLVVTARPNSSALAEPDADLFQTVQLEPMSSDAQWVFLGKWCAAIGLTESEKAELERVFKSRAALDHVAQLTDNPMQLAILLFLIYRKGEAVPMTRTALYTDYMDTLMDREVTRNQIDRDQVPQIREVTSVLGWHIHSEVESDPGAERMSRKRIVQALWNYFYETDNETDRTDIDSLFSATSDRFWALSSKIEGTFEFAVQPVREYFAAKFLAEYAGNEQRQPPVKADVLRQLIDSSYWLNTARFYAGFARPNEVPGLRYGLQGALAEGHHPLQERQMVWALLGDGIFADNSHWQRDVVNLLLDDLSLTLLAPLPDLPSTGLLRLRQVCGGDMFAHAIQARLEKDPGEPLAFASVSLLRHGTSLSERNFVTWWRDHLLEATTDEVRTAWLNIGGFYGVAGGYFDQALELSLSTPSICRAVIKAGLRPQLDTPENAALVRAVLNGWCSDELASGQGEAAALLRASRPQWYLRSAFSAIEPPFPTGHLWLTESDTVARTAAWTRLAEINPAYKDLQSATSTRARGRKGTTEPWMAPARVLCCIHGPSWLAAEIAIIGAASQDTHLSGSLDSHGEALGPEVDYGTFVYEVRMHGTDVTWWTKLHDTYQDSLSRRTWVLAMLSTAVPAVTGQHLKMIDTCLEDLPDEEFESIAVSSSRIGATTSRRRMAQALFGAADIGPRTRLLLSHFCADRKHLDPLSQLTDDDLLVLASPDPSAWPIIRAITARLRDTEKPSLALMNALAACGPAACIGPIDTGKLGQATISEIIASPMTYPTGWVRAAERTLSSSSKEPPMRRIAQENGWIPPARS